MFSRVLIANRGEIAVRIIRTLRRLGIGAIAVYSEADREALHVRLADEAYPIGPAPAAQSYLAIDRILGAARASGADAIHPGYGFLAEKAAFAGACRAAGITFIGPAPGAIALMGDKLAARVAARNAGVPVVPGSDRPVANSDGARAQAETLGYPVLIKAAAGGGGYGMRVVRKPDELPAALEASGREAARAFGDGALYLEQFFDPPPRHVEVQVLGDHHGRVVHLFERECSVQRRYQKVIEEAPSPALDDDQRAGLAAAAVALAEGIGYQNAGTVEFLLDAAGGFYFLEMNTRLQVEHPVTELISGLDLVEQQVRIAAGESIPPSLPAKPAGWAIEARVYAERPEKGFMPAPGTVSSVSEPVLPGIRVDSGVAAGSEISYYYDPLIAKVIAHGSSRDQARQRLAAALDQLQIEGISTNARFLRSVIEHPDFAAGRIHTRFLEERLEEILQTHHSSLA